LLEMWGSGASDVYAVGFGPAQHWDGHAWTPMPEILGQNISGSGPSDVWVGASNGLQHFDGLAWSRVPEMEGRFVQCVTVRDVDNVWVATLHNGIQAIEHFDGSAWTVGVEIPAASNANVVGIGVGSDGDIWVVGRQAVGPSLQTRGYLLRFDGTRWT